MKNFTGVILSLATSACLVSGIQALSDFGFYISVAVNLLAWIGLFCGMVKGGAAANIRKRVWINAPSSIIALAALLYTDHPMLAASRFMVQFFILAMAFKKEPAAA